MKYKNSSKLPRTFFADIYVITKTCGQQAAQDYAETVSNQSVFLEKPLFTYKGCEILTTGSPYVKYCWSIVNYDGKTNKLCGYADTIDDILDDIKKTLDK